MTTKKCPLIIHPFIFAIYPWIFLYTANLGGLSAKNFIILSGITLLVTTLSFVLLGKVIKRWAASGLIISSSLLLFFYYGHIHEYLYIEYEIFLGRHTYLLTICGILYLGCWYIAFRSTYKFIFFTKFLNLVSVALLIGGCINFGLQRNLSGGKAQAFPITSTGLSAKIPQASKVSESYRDIYYIILDGYARQDTLAALYDYPENGLVKYLSDKGFYIAAKSTSNYADTTLSLASSLNLNHLRHLRDEFGADSTDRSVIYQMIENNEVVRFLKDNGYTYIHYGSGFEPTQRNHLADVTVNCYPAINDQLLPLLLKTTLLSVAAYHFPHHWFYSYKEEGAKKLCMFSSIKTAIGERSPKFVFMHITLPHPPFLFKQDGSLNDVAPTSAIYLWNDRAKYKEQLIFLNQKVKAMIEQILSQSKTLPIIIVQGDHGPASSVDFDNPSEQGVKERMQILNAYLLPGGGEEKLYESISPVNSFRVVFNQYFGTNLKLEEDRSYFSAWYRPYKFVDVTEMLINSPKADNAKIMRAYATESAHLPK